MNRFCKAAAGIGGGIIALGVVLILAGFLLGGSYRELNHSFDPGMRIGFFRLGEYRAGEWEFGSYQAQTGKTEFSQSFDGIQSLSLDCSLAEVSIVSGAGFRVEAKDLGLFAFQCQQEGERLSVLCEPSWGSGGLGIGEIPPEVTITLPEDFWAREISLKVDAGILRAEGLRGSRVRLESDKSQVTLEDFASQGGSVECDMGTVSIAGTASGPQKVECSMGEVTMKLVGDPQVYGCRTSSEMGEIIFAGQTCSGMGGEFSRDAGTSDFFEIECDMGSVTVEITPPDQERE